MKKLLPLIFVGALFTNCAKDPLEHDTPAPIQTVEEGVMVLGKKLENPYSVTNMKKAFESLPVQTRSSVGTSADDVIYPTHYYVKFKPKTDEELGILKSDSTLILYSYPLDYEIVSYGDYHDPSVPQGQPTYYYASVEVGKTLTTELEWEILEDLFIPDEDKDGEEEVTKLVLAIVLV